MDPVSFSVFAFCLSCASYSAYKIGEKQGITGCLNWLESEGYIDFKE